MSSRARIMPDWVIKADWLIAAIKEYQELRPVQVLVTARFDESAVSDGTAGCHFKDEAFVYASNAVRNELGPRLDTTLQAIDKCNDVVNHFTDKDYNLSDQAQSYFTFALNALRKARDATDRDTIALLADCIALSDADEWCDTPYGKGIKVRARKNVPGKEEKEKTIQARLIDGAEKRHPATDAGYDGDLGKLIRQSKRFLKGYIPVIHFAAMTLDSLHNSHNTSKTTWVLLTRILFKGIDNKTTSLKHAYDLCFRHSADGKFVSTDEPTGPELLDVGQGFEGESKVLNGQQGVGIYSSDDEVWLARFKVEFGRGLLIYLFNHPAFTDIEYSLDDTRQLLEGICGMSAPTYTLAEADAVLDSFDFRGGATNPRLIELFAAATVPRPGFGAGSAKYIETIVKDVAFREAPEQVAINYHHILTTDGQQVKDRAAKLNAAHGNAPAAGFGNRYIAADKFAIPFSVDKFFNQVVEEFEEGRPLPLAEVMRASGISNLDCFTRR